MRVLFSCNLPFALAHGGTQTLIESLMRELTALGVVVEPERWWDAAQQGDILHYVGRPASALPLRLAQQAGRRVVMTEFLDQTASRSAGQLWAQRTLTQLARALVPGLTQRMAWDVYRELDAMVYAAPHEWETAKYLFDAEPSRGHIIPHGLELPALAALREPQAEGDYLVSIATITARKNSVLLAEAARAARVPVVFLGKPYAESEEYFQRFRALVDGECVRYPGFVSEEEKIRWLRGARGFALMSQFESGCIAVYEAAAAGLPMLLADLPWATQVYGETPGITFAAPSARGLAAQLGQFHATARRQPRPIFPVPSWRMVAQSYLQVYERLLEPRRSGASPGLAPAT